MPTFKKTAGEEARKEMERKRAQDERELSVLREQIGRGELSRDAIYARFDTILAGEESYPGMDDRHAMERGATKKADENGQWTEDYARLFDSQAAELRVAARSNPQFAREMFETMLAKGNFEQSGDLRRAMELSVAFGHSSVGDLSDVLNDPALKQRLYEVMKKDYPEILDKRYREVFEENAKADERQADGQFSIGQIRQAAEEQRAQSGHSEARETAPPVHHADR